MPSRDPQTGKFVADSDQYSDVEVVHAGVDIGVAAADMAGGTGIEGADDKLFEGLKLYDTELVADRDEVLYLIDAYHRVNVYQNSTATEDGTIRASVEVSGSPSRKAAHGIASQSAVPDSSPSGVTADSVKTANTWDLIGPVLTATGHAPFSDTATGIGGAGTAGIAKWEGGVPEPMRRFDPRDDIFVNGSFEAWNIDDAAIHADVQVMHVFGVEKR